MNLNNKKNISQEEYRTNGVKSPTVTENGKNAKSAEANQDVDTYVIGRYWRGFYVETICKPTTKENAELLCREKNKTAGVFDNYKVVAFAIKFNEKKL